MDAAEEVWSAFLALDEAFARGDVEAVMAGFVDDPDLTLWRSSEVERAVGPDGAAAVHHPDGRSPGVLHDRL